MNRAVINPSYRQRLGYHATLLGAMALLASALLVVGFTRTKDDIAARMDEDLQASLQQVVPASIYDNNLLKDTVTLPLQDVNGTAVKTIVYRARKGQQIVGLAYQVTGYGYSGAIEIILGVDPDGKLLGVRVVSHAETPGLGDKIEERKSKWILAFTGLSLVNPSEAQWHVKKDGGYFDQFSGATITPRAVVAAVKQGLLQFKAHRDELLNTPSDTALTENSGGQ